jgi:hypothetical protein
MGWQRLVAASGIVFAVLMVISLGLFGGDTPSFNDPLKDWTNWANDNDVNNRIAAMILLFAAFEFIWFAGYMHSVLGAAERAVRGFTRGANVVLGGAIAGIVGIVMGVTITAIASQHTDADPQVIRSVADAGGAGFVLATAGFAAMLLAAGALTLRTGAFPRWTGIVALVGGVLLVLTFLSLLDKEGDNVFGIGYPLGFLALVIWSIATSISNIRRLREAPRVAEPGAPAV